MIFIATFYSHFGAMRCKKECDKAGISARLMPVPRMLSSSCGTCVRIESEDAERIPRTEESEQRLQDPVESRRKLKKAFREKAERLLSLFGQSLPN